jgi:hypothetical protein
MLQKIAKECFNHAHLWATETVPYFTRLYFQNLWHGSKRMAYKDTFRKLSGRNDFEDAHFFSNWWLITLQSALIPVALIMGVFVQLNHFINKLIAPALDSLKNLFKNYQKISLAISFAKSFGMISGLLLTAGIMFFVPAIIMQALNAVVWAGILVAVIAPIALQGYFALTRSSDRVENETPYIGHKNLAALGLSLLFPWITPSKINGLIAKAGGVFVAHTAKFSLSEAIEKYFSSLNVEEKKNFFSISINNFLQDGRDFIEKDFFLIEEDIFQITKNYLFDLIINNYPQFVSIMKAIVKNAAVSAVQSGVDSVAENFSKFKEWITSKSLQNAPLNNNDNNAPGYYAQFNTRPAESGAIAFPEKSPEVLPRSRSAMV